MLAYLPIFFWIFMAIWLGGVVAVDRERWGNYFAFLAVVMIGLKVFPL